MGPKVIEGTWEEGLRHGPELAGRRVRVAVLDEPEGAVMLDQPLAPLIRAAEELLVAPPAIDDPIEESVADKFRRITRDIRPVVPRPSWSSKARSDLVFPLRVNGWCAEIASSSWAASEGVRAMVWGSAVAMIDDTP